MNNINYFEDGKLLESFNKSRVIQIKNVYRHFKGGWYLVEEIALDCETKEKLVVYRSLKDQQLWVRPLEDFLSIKQTEKGYVLRFSLCEY
jgi:hypothetical protein